MTEVLLSIAVIAIIGIVVYPLYQRAEDSATAKKLSDNVIALSIFVRNMYQGQSEGTMYNNIESNANAILKQYADINGYNEQETLQDYDLLPSDSGLWMIDMRNNTNIPMNTRICADFIQNIAPISERILVEAPNVVRIQDNYQVPPKL